MSREVENTINVAAFINACEAELTRIAYSCKGVEESPEDMEVLPEDITTLPEDYRNLVTNKKIPALINVFEDAIYRLEHNTENLIEHLNKTGKRRIAKEDSECKITYHLIVDENNDILLFFDSNNKWNGDNRIFHTKKNPKWKAVEKGGQVQVRHSFLFHGGKIRNTVTSVPLTEEQNHNFRSKQQSLLSSLGENPFIIKYYFSEKYVKENQETKDYRVKLAYFSPLMKYASLNAYLKKCNKKRINPNKLPSFHVLWFIFSWVSGLEFLHLDKKVVHRDIKPANIFITEDEHGPTSKIGDLGMVCPISSIKERGLAGSPHYFSFDNRYFKDLIKNLRKEKFKNEYLSKENFLEIINASKNPLDDTPIFYEVKTISENITISILWEKIQSDEKFDCTETYADPKEDIYQLCITIQTLLNKYRKLNKNHLPEVLENIEIYIKRQMRLVRAERDDIIKFKDKFLKELNKFVESGHPDASSCLQLFEKRIESLEAEYPKIKIPEIFTNKKKQENSNPRQRASDHEIFKGKIIKDNIKTKENKEKKGEENNNDKSKTTSNDKILNSTLSSSDAASWDNKGNSPIQSVTFRLLSNVIKNGYWEGKATGEM